MQSCSSNAIGNPLTYYNGNHYTFTWEGRRLVGATKETDTYSFTYNEDGIRTSKTKNGVTTNYYLSGSMIIAEETSGNVTIYLYDESGSPIGFRYRGSTYAENVWDTYFYEKNLQGDIVAVYSDAGVKLITYTYDAWGNFTVSPNESSIAAKNPFTYRGYYYDRDLGLYYLNSRYYDANTCRFISPDDTEYLGANGDLNSYNLYAYCSNNPVMYTDPSGHFVVSALIGAIIAGALVGALTKYVPDVCEKAIQDGFQWNDLAIDKESLKEYTIAAAKGAVLGAAYGTGLGMAAAAFQAGATLSVGSIAVGLAITNTTSAVAGMGIYALETKVFELGDYNAQDMLYSGVNMSIQSMRHYSAGLFAGSIGAYTNLNFPNSLIVRSFLKYPFVGDFNMKFN